VEKDGRLWVVLRRRSYYSVMGGGQEGVEPREVLMCRNDQKGEKYTEIVPEQRTHHSKAKSSKEGREFLRPRAQFEAGKKNKH